MLMPGLLICVLSGIAAFAMTWLIRRHAQRLGVIATPNARSSHTSPTPSGGGVGFVLGGAITTAFVASYAPWPTVLVLAVSLVIAAIGFFDDRRPIRAAIRLSAQLLLVALVLLFGIPLDLLQVQLGLPLPVPVLAILAVPALVYWINLFNFMDGIDGLAGSEAVFLLLGAALLGFVFIPGAAWEPTFWWLCGLAAATSGFLVLNWPPAKIFMGDAGSLYLGFLLGFLALVTICLDWLSLWQWLILGAVFIADATVTLVRRLWQRERVFEAHRRHAYQALARRWQSHRRVTLMVLAVNLLWLLPLAFVAGMNEALAPAIAGLAYAPLIAVALWLGAGAPEVSDPGGSR